MTTDQAPIEAPQADRQPALTRWLIPRRNPAGTVYGILVVGSILAAEASRTIEFLPLIAAVLVAMALYWLAHAYAQVLGRRLESTERWSPRRLIAALGHELAIMRGASLPLVVLVLAALLGASVSTAVNAALVSCAVSMAGLEVLAGVGEGLSVVEIVLEAGVGLTMGVGLFALKILLH